MTKLEIVFLLLWPARGGNVGAAARALTTMGFDDLRIVGRPQFDYEEARVRAHGSTELLDAMRYFESLEAALADCDVVVGTSGRKRGRCRDSFTPAVLRDHLCHLGAKRARVALLFGPENYGLSNRALKSCQIISHIPMVRPYPSLNLAQAVMVYAYAFSPAQIACQPVKTAPADPQSLRVLQERMRALLPRLGFAPNSALAERILARAALVRGVDLRLLHSLSHAVGRCLGQIEGSNGFPEVAGGQGRGQNQEQ